MCALMPDLCHVLWELSTDGAISQPSTHQFMQLMSDPPPALLRNVAKKDFALITILITILFRTQLLFSYQVF